MRFKNKIALVTGTSSGIGKKIVDQLIKEGCIVIATARKDAPKKIPKKLEYYKIDVTSLSEWNALSKYIKKNPGIARTNTIRDSFKKLNKLNFLKYRYMQ